MADKIGTIRKETRKRKNYSVSDVQKLLFDRYQATISDKTIYAWESNRIVPNLAKFLRRGRSFPGEVLSSEPKA